jgi:putative membrane protein
MMDNPYGYDHGHDMGGAGWLLGLLVIVLFALLVSFVVVLVVRLTRPRPNVAASTDASTVRSSSARQILDERLARGEIDASDYRERRVMLDEG